MALTWLALTSAFPVQQAAAEERSGPPGTVFVPGGPTRVGIDARAAREIALGHRRTSFAPGPAVTVESFYLGVSEVTNEQYLAFVDATGARPPESWGLRAIDVASRAWAGEQNLAVRRARDEGLEHERVRFDQARWWRDNWQTSAWRMPQGSGALPVTYVDYADAQAYARWAGVRLMNEFEYVRAGRGDDKAAYPWGDEWDPKACANQERSLRSAREVGSFPSGVSPYGVHDLAGNVWEWTSSPFVPFGNWNTRGLDTALAWDANQRIVVGGSFQLGPTAARLSTRRGTERTQSAEALGFRVAASLAPCADIAAALLERSDTFELEDFDVTRPVGIDRWRSSPGSARAPRPTGHVPLANYAVITGYDYLFVTPARSIEETSRNALDKTSHEPGGPVLVGLLCSSREVLSPPLGAGVYRMAYRGAGPLREHESAGGPAEGLTPAVTYPSGFEPEQAHLVFWDAEGSVAAVLAIPEPEYAKTFPSEVGITDDAPASQGSGPASTLVLRLAVPARPKSRVFAWTIRLGFAPGEIGPDWRR